MPSRVTPSIRNLADLDAIKQRVDDARKKCEFHVAVCAGTACRAAGAETLKSLFEDEIKRQGLKANIVVDDCGCMGFCAVGPVAIINPGEIFYQRLTPDDVGELVREHLGQNKPVERLMFHDEITGEIYRTVSSLPFIAEQTLVALRNCGVINPERIEDYIWRDGYRGLYRALTELEPRDIINEVKESGLRGRGGGGFPTGLKWEFCASAKGDTKYVLCNADEGDPGAFMDRSLLESDPHAVLEGMIIAARAIGAHHGYVYCRAEYPLALQRLQTAIDQATEAGLIGPDVFGTGFGFDLEIYKGAGAFVCGEETALMLSIQGERGTPRPRPPFPAVSGLWAKPTVLNNVETYGNIPQIISHGGAEYAKIGTESAKGTKVFALSGKIHNFGLVEVPMGTPLDKIIQKIGGGVPDGKRIKAVQLGGPSGGCIPAHMLNIPVDYDEIVKAGAIMGSGGMVVMDENTCMVDVARFFMDFCQDESCGKCTPCRIGTRRMLEILERICHGEGREGDIELLESLATTIKDAALCGLGQTAPNPVLSTIRYFRHEYEEHIRDKKCRAGVCSGMFKSPCQHACPIDTDVPAYLALIRADRVDDAYRVLSETNPFPSICGRVCGQPCTLHCRRAQLDEPLAIRHLKRYAADNAKHDPVKELPTTRSEEIAIIGAGPAGLTAALELRRRGYAVTVFEELPEPGGMMRYAIPEYRLPRDVIKKEIDDILATGVELRTKTRIGRDILMNDLKKDYRAIYIATGAHQSWTMGIPGEDKPGVFGAVELLRQFNLNQAPKIGRNVAVIGGGNSAIDAARTALREGAETVTIFYRRERNDMPALAEEVEAAIAEGVKMEFLSAPVSLQSDNGHVSAMTLQRMELGSFDSGGRRRPVPIDGSDYTVSVDTVISAVGQAADFACLEKCDSVKAEKGKVKVDRQSRTSDECVWAGGDVALGPATVVEAIQAGRVAAQEIDAAIRKANGEPAYVKPARPKIDIPYEVEEETVSRPREAIPELAAVDRIGSYAEVEHCYDRETAIREASRCLRCDGDRGKAE